MKQTSPVFRLLAIPTLILALAAPAAAQNWSGDARHIAMGGIGTGQNLASQSVQETEHYRSIVLPFGLLQILQDTDVFDPDSDDFDLIRIIEYAASPLHYTQNRTDSDTGADFFTDIGDATLMRDLNTYRGFVPLSQPIGYGLANPSWGGTIPVYKSKSKTTRHGIFVGGGPYMAMRGALTIDDDITRILGSDTPLYIPNTSMPIAGDTRGEVALQVTGGYRGRFPLSGLGKTDRDGIYVAVNYSYIRGFFMEDATTIVRLQTDANGLLTNPSGQLPLVLSRVHSDEGRGRNIDAGVAAVTGRWEFGFGVNGIANEIRWQDVEQTNYTLNNLFNGQEIQDGPTIEIGERTLEQPVEYSGNATYDAGRWSASAQLAKKVSNFEGDDERLNSTAFRAGVEYRFGLFEPRGGVFYVRKAWQPSGGVGLNFGKFGVDAAVYTTDANVERERHTTFAFSLRFGARTPLVP